MEIFETVENPDEYTLIPIFRHYASQKNAEGDEIVASLVEQVLILHLISKVKKQFAGDKQLIAKAAYNAIIKTKLDMFGPTSDPSHPMHRASVFDFTQHFYRFLPDINDPVLHISTVGSCA
jgi:hypothetical protein